MSRRIAILIAALITGLACAASVEAQRIIYVDDDAPLGGDGATWATAYKYLQDGLAGATSGDEIRVAGGIYKPDQDEGGNVIAGDRFATFRLQNGLVLVGGYAGLANPLMPDIGDIHFYKSILSGDLAGDDEPNFVNNDENTYNIVTAEEIDEQATLDGFTFTAANANGYSYYEKVGGGVIALFSTVRVVDCTFVANMGRNAGAVYLHYSDGCAFIQCTFEKNYAAINGYGGAMGLSYTDVLVDNCVFAENSAEHFGGAVFVWSGEPKFVDCVFRGNTAELEGGAVDNVGDGFFVNCLFAGNISHSKGGAMINSGNPTITNCTFSGNSARWGGGGLSNGGSPWISNCIFWGNQTDSGAGESAQIYQFPDGSATVSYSCIAGLNVFSGYANIGDDPLFANPLGPDGIAGTGDEDLRLLPGSACIGAGNHLADIDANTDGYQPLPATDLGGHPRLLCDWVDMGAYEFGIGDFDCNETVDLPDFANWSTCMTGPFNGPYGPGCNAFDFVFDLSVDLQDFAGFQSMIHFEAERKLRRKVHFVE